MWVNNSQPWVWGHTERPSSGSVWGWCSWRWPGPSSWCLHQPHSSGTAPGPPPPDQSEKMHTTVWGVVQLQHLIGLVLHVIRDCASYSVTFTFCRASSSSLLFFSSCLFTALDCSSRERLVEDWAFSYSSFLCVFSARAFRKAASASCCQNHKSNDNHACDYKYADWQQLNFWPCRIRKSTKSSVILFKSYIVTKLYIELKWYLHVYSRNIYLECCGFGDRQHSSSVFAYRTIYTSRQTGCIPFSFAPSATAPWHLSSTCPAHSCVPEEARQRHNFGWLEDCYWCI